MSDPTAGAPDTRPPDNEPDGTLVRPLAPQTRPADGESNLDATLVRPTPATNPSVHLPPVNATGSEAGPTLLGHSAVPPAIGSAEPSPRSASRFRPLRLHARGGLGQVFLALDEELGREVALKEIQHPHADDPDSRARFLLEAEVTGALEHPGVVPVYGLGAYTDGRPYYAMRFIRGGSLQDAIQRFHEADLPGRDPGERALALSGLLRRFIDLCNAIAYAHSKGIIHRDIKPANVMLGQYGETLVVDWGLAKKVGATGHRSPTVFPSPPDSTPRPHDATAPFAAVQTVAGSAVGTPAFMSPEQAAGDVAVIGPLSDVYSLGATLYVLLAGHQPFGSRGVADTLEMVKQGTFPPPREVKVAVPPGLEAVCLKAMSARPEDRYPSAKALAEDVERWLADEPVTAYREPLLTRAGRWARRHRTTVTASAVLLVTAVVALTVTTALVANEKAKTERQRRLAEDNFHTALAAVNDMLTEAAQEQLADEPRMTKKRRALLERARAYYRQFLDQHGDEPRLRREAALAHKRLGDVSKYLGEYPQAREEYGEAIGLFEPLVAHGPGDHGLRAVLAETYCNLGEAWRRGTRPERAEESYARALELQRRLTQEAPQEPEYQKNLARTQYNRGILFKDTGRPELADEALAESVGLLARLAEQHPRDPTYRQHLARAYLNRGPVLRALGRPRAARDACREAIRLQKELIAADRYVPDYRHELGASYNNLGFLYRSLGRAARAEGAHREAVALFERLVLDYPDVPTYRLELAKAHNNLAIALARQRRWQDAGRAWEAALELCVALTTEFPDETEYQAQRALALGNLGWLGLQPSRDPAGVAALAGLCGKPPLAAVALAALGVDRKEALEKACQRLEGAIALDRAALAHNADDPLYQQALRDQSEYLAEARLLLGAHAEAAKAVEGLPAVPRTRAADHVLAAELLLRCAAVAGDDPAVSRYADRAVEHLRQAVAAGFTDAERLNGPAFAPLRGREDFRKLLASLRPAP